MTQRKFNVSSLSIPAEGTAVDAQCADITFVNFGNRASPPVGADLIVDSVIKISPGQQYVIAAASPDEFNVTKHALKWDTTNSAITEGVVLRKIFRP